MRLNPKYLQALALLGVGTAFSIAGSFGSFHDLKKGEVCTPLRCSVRIVPAWIPTSGEAIAIRQGDGAQMLGLSFAGFVFTGGALACFLRGREEEREYLEKEADVKAQIAQGKRLERQQQAHWARMAGEVERQRAEHWAAREIFPLQVLDWQPEAEEEPFGEPPALPHSNPGTLDDQTKQGKLGERAQPTVLTKTPEEKVGLECLDSIVSTRRSILYVGDTGSGKSVSQSYRLSRLFTHDPKAEVWVVAQKNDSFCGLRSKGRVVIFDKRNPAPAVKAIAQVYDLYEKRRHLPEHERKNLPFVRLVLADWLSINAALEEEKPEDFSVSDLADIIYNGRDSYVGLDIDLQSFNLKAIGLKADRNSRKNFDLIGLANRSVDPDGSVVESYGVLENLLNDRYIIADAELRTKLYQEFLRLKPISQKIKRPIIYSSLGNKLGLLPDLRAFKETPRTRSNKVHLDASQYDPSQWEAIYSLEFDVNAPTSQAKEEKSLSPEAQKVLDYCQRKVDESGQEFITVKEIQASGCVAGAKAGEIRSWLSELARLGKGEYDPKQGFKPG
jgi:hypothetical protein